MTAPPAPSPQPSGCIGALAIAAATLVVSVILALATSLLPLLPIVFIIALVVSLGIGLPILHVLRRTGRTNWLTVAGGGFVAGAIAPAMQWLPWPETGETVVTVAGHGYAVATGMLHLAFIGGFGITGIIGALIAWYLINWFYGDDDVRAHLRWRGGLLAVSVAAAIYIGAMVPDMLMDHSCHNPTRDGRTSIAASATFDIRLPSTAWPTLQREIESFARSRGWSLRTDMNPGSQVEWFYASLCIDSGTQILMQNGIDGDISISVTQPQGGNSWRLPFRTLQQRLEKRWPGSVVYLFDPHPPWPPRATSAKPVPSIDR
jgi:MFS family permease